MGDHQGLLRRVVRSFAHVTEDLLQEILLQARISQRGCRGDSKETTWLYQMAFNAAMVWQRKEQRRRMRHEAFSAFTLHAPPASEGGPAANHLVKRLLESISEPRNI